MKHKVSVIIAAHNEAKKIGPVVRRLLRWVRRPEVIVICNGCNDGTAVIAKRAGARVIRFRNKLGPDVGRAIGLAVAKGDICLVLDADMLIPLKQLEPFVRAVEQGVDIALNQYPFIGTKQYHHPTAVAKHALNIFADRSDLRASSLTAVPHAVSRHALTTLGPLAFCVPPVAQARAICAGLRVELAGRVAVGALNPRRSVAHQKLMRRLIIGDCLEGMATLIASRGLRGGFTDLHRQRSLAQTASFTAKRGMRRVAVIPTQGEDSLSGVIHSLEQADVDEIRLVINGVEENQLEHLEVGSKRAEIDYFRDRVGHDVGRAIGCMQVDAEAYFVTDADIPISDEQIRPFFDAIDLGVDVALNDLNQVLTQNRQTDPPSWVKRFVNLACDRPDLGVASLTAVPHAISGKCLRDLGAAEFVVPPVAQVEALLRGHQISAVYATDVITTNAHRPELHSASSGQPLQQLIVGDHLEAIARLQDRLGSRVFFEDNVRRRDIAERYIMNRGLVKAPIRR